MNEPGKLDTWKEIAVYLGREVRTVQRWEKHEGLPVHRHGHKSRGSVYALKSELDTWRDSRRNLQAAPEPVLAQTDSRPTSAPPFAGSLRGWLPITATMLVILVVLLWNAPANQDIRGKFRGGLPNQSNLPNPSH